MQIYSIKLTRTVYFVDQHQVEELSKYRPTFDVRDIKLFILFRLSDLFKDTGTSSTSQIVSNPHLKQMDDDVLFHIGIRVGDLDIKKVFGDVKVKVFFSLKGTIFSLNGQS